MKFGVACYKFFGLKKDQKLSDLLVEVRQLTPEDKAEMAPMLAKALGEEVTIVPETGAGA